MRVAALFTRNLAEGMLSFGDRCHATRFIGDVEMDVAAPLTINAINA